MRPWCLAACCFAVILAVPPMAAAAPSTEDAIATIKHVTGTPQIVRQGAAIPAAVGTRLLSGDSLRTPTGSTLGVVFADDTLLTLGPSSEVAIDEYVFAPAEQRLSLVARVLRGTIGYISGQLARLAPSAVRLITPSATVATRGTYVLIRVP